MTRPRPREYVWMALAALLAAVYGIGLVERNTMDHEQNGRVAKVVDAPHTGASGASTERRFAGSSPAPSTSNAAGQAFPNESMAHRSDLGRTVTRPVPAAPSYAAPQTSASARTDGHYALRPTGSAVAAPSTWPQALAACMNGGSVVYEDPLTGNSIGIFCDRQVVSAAVANHNRGAP